jgi:serine protease inhibitor
MNSLTTDETAVNLLIQANTQFALDLYQKIRTEPGNLFFSPYSISTALAMTYAGARGETAVQMAQTLRLTMAEEQLHPVFGRLEAMLNEIEQKGDIQLRVANALWPHVKYNFLPDYLALLEKYYGTSVTAVDYNQAEAARQMINEWVEEKTADKIKNLIPAGTLDALTRLVLVNAIYFKGNWANQFNPDVTEKQPFWLAAGGSVDVPLMRRTTEFGYAERDDLQILELPYTGRDLSMIVLLPREIDGLAGLEEKLTPANLARWTDRLWSTKVVVLLPKFRLTFTMGLNGVLQEMGMADAFSMGKANFSGMDGTKELYMGAVLHKAFVEVNEEGTEAAAATAVVMVASAAPPQPPPVFRADHPFLFLIRENSTGSILFLGRVTNPV